MAKTNMVEREKKRAKLVKKYAAKRKELKAIVLSPKSSYDEKMAAQAKLQKLPRDASPIRQRNRQGRACRLQVARGRPQGARLPQQRRTGGRVRSLP